MVHSVGQQRDTGQTTAAASQAIRLFQGYALIMEWAAYNDSRKADWEAIGRGKTSQVLLCARLFIFI